MDKSKSIKNFDITNIKKNLWEKKKKNILHYSNATSGSNLGIKIKYSFTMFTKSNI